MSRRGNCWDNAVAESFFSSLKKERVNRQVYRTRDLATPISSNTSRCSTIEPDAIAISAASVPRRLKSPQTVASKCLRNRGKSTMLDVMSARTTQFCFFTITSSWYTGSGFPDPAHSPADLVDAGSRASDTPRHG